ncbi:MAG: hypothetical protein DWQ05_06225 [Calditrichaeota bacterium]|nr:MAG: hypothetical protein DWQ05_06225 [Calditrichota bacterium]
MELKTISFQRLKTQQPSPTKRAPLRPTIKLATTTTPDGHALVLSQHDRDFYISVNGRQLMNSREHKSELELARLGCHCVQEREQAQVLIGGLGMGFTLRQTLELVPQDATVTVAELIPEVVDWNRNFLGGLTQYALQDQRVAVKSCDVLEIIHASAGIFDAILLDVDNGPGALTHANNDKLYRPAGLHAMMRALKKDGCLAIWSVARDMQFESVLRQQKLHFRTFRAHASKSSKSRSRCIWLIAQQKLALPPASFFLN